MAEEKWRQMASDAIYEMLCASFGMQPDSAEAMKRFVPAYVFEATTPQADRNVNVCYYDIRPASTPNLQYTETTYAPKDAQEPKAMIENHMPITVLFTFYGPDADNDSEYFWTLCQSDVDSSSPRAVLRKKAIVFNGKPEFPAGLDEIEGTFIRRRCDVRLNLVLYNVHYVPYGTVEQIPDFDTSAEIGGGIIVQY